MPACFAEQATCAALVRSCRGASFGAPTELGALDVLLKLLERARDSPGSGAINVAALLESLTDNVERFFLALAIDRQPQVERR